MKQHHKVMLRQSNHWIEIYILSCIIDLAISSGWHVGDKPQRDQQQTAP